MKEEIFTGENSRLPQSGQEKSVGQRGWVLEFPVRRAGRGESESAERGRIYGLRSRKEA
jgi:hypothetical protein